MKNRSRPSFNDLVETHLGKRLPREMAAPVALAKEPPEARAFILRMLKLMKTARYPTTSFTPYFIRWLNSIKTMLPSAWGGQIPPLTVPGRHTKLDAYVKAQHRFDQKEHPVFLDMGCGFPPVTTADTARALPDWQIFGVDQSFPDFIVFNEEGHYACFDNNGEFQYFQALMTPSGRALYQDPQGTRESFTALFEEFKRKGLPPKGNPGDTLENKGCRLIRDHVRQFETKNLNFIKSDIRNTGLPQAQVIRAMNVWLYFDARARARILGQAADLLEDGGLLILGTNGLGIQRRYFVCEKQSQGLIPLEFAFSPDNLGPISFMAWFTLHENDPEALLLAHLSRDIRGHDGFWNDFSHTLDSLLQQSGLCRRGPDGFFQVDSREILFAEYRKMADAIWKEIETQGYVDGAVDVLCQAGHEAWKNHVGDISVKPVPQALN